MAIVDIEVFKVDEGSSVGALAEEIMRRHPQLEELRGSVRYSVNFEVVGEDIRLSDEDEVGVLPPVAGG